jgi:hypothetical protein
MDSLDVHDGNSSVLGVSTLDLAQESAGSNDIESGNTEQSLGVKDTSLLEDFGKDGDGRVDGVGDDADHGLGAVFSTCLGKVTNDRGVGVLSGEKGLRCWAGGPVVIACTHEQVISGHSRLSGNTSGDDNDFSALESGSDATNGRW